MQFKGRKIPFVSRFEGITAIVEWSPGGRDLRQLVTWYLESGLRVSRGCCSANLLLTQPKLLSHGKVTLARRVVFSLLG